MKLSSHWLIPTLLLAAFVPANAQGDDKDMASRAGLPLSETASRGIVTRDPSTIVKCKDEFWVFYTGHGIPSFHSQDLVKWEPGPPVFQTAPEWIAAAVPGNKNMNYWAPDIIHLGDQYLLYYAVSSFGKITSAIGLATTPTLDPADPAYHWTDRGIVIQSHEGGDFNAIDPSVFHDTNGTLWLAFGSYWSGIKLTQLDSKTGKRLNPDAPLTALAYNKSIEASCLYKHGGYYYLFVNWGSCCRGVNSTYNIRVGRSKKVTGPYIDKEGVDMLKAGGSLLLSNNGPLFGPGHAGILIDKGKSWFTSDFEGDSRMGGKATLAIMPLTWKSGWPEVEVVDK
jgi:arabinan endo-1,5-alpha-L-arabinosidase